MRTLVMKFGGTSVGNAQALTQAACIVKDQKTHWDALVVVVSAMNGVTNTLLQCAQAATRGEEQTYTRLIGELRFKHLKIVDTLIADPVKITDLTGMIEQAYQ